MMSKILGIVKANIKNYNVTSDLGSDEALVTLLAADLYKSLVVQTDVVAKTPPRKKPKPETKGLEML